MINSADNFKPTVNNSEKIKKIIENSKMKNTTSKISLDMKKKIIVEYI